MMMGQIAQVFDSFEIKRFILWEHEKSTKQNQPLKIHDSITEKHKKYK